MASTILSTYSSTDSSTHLIFPHLPIIENRVLTPFRGHNSPSPVTHLIDKVNDKELALFSLGRKNLYTIYPKFNQEGISTFEGVLSEQGLECYNTIIQALKDHKEEEGCFEESYPETTEDCYGCYNNISLRKPSGYKTTPMIFLETNVENLKNDRPDIVGWCISASGKLRLMDQTTTVKVKLFLKEKCRDELGSLYEIEQHRFKENQTYRSMLNKLGICYVEDE